MDPLSRQKLLYVKGLKDIKCDVPGFKGELEDYQRVGVAFCVIGKRVILGDPCGAGKTVMSIATDLKLRDMGEVRRTLVVGLSDKRADWAKEYRQFSDIPTHIIDGPRINRTQQWIEASNDRGVTIASYEQVRADMIDRVKDDLGNKTNHPSGLLRHIHYDMIIFDEASLFKTWESTLADALRELIVQCRPTSVIACTAFAIEKHLEDVVSIMDKVEPGLFPDYDQFTLRYVMKKWIRTNRGGFWKVLGYLNTDELAMLMAPYHIGRTREEVFGHRTKRWRKIRNVSLTRKQEIKYEQLRNSVDEGTNRSNLLQVYQEMERIVDTMVYFDPNDHSSAKLDDLLELLTGELADEKVLIFSKFHKPLEELRLRLLDKKIPFINYTGQQSIEERNQNLADFNEKPEIRAALITLAAEKGKNFQSAHYIIFINHIMNPAKTDQLIGRIDRGVAQKSDFICSIHYVTRGTFEEDTIPKLDSERDLFHKIFGGSDGTVEVLSDKQLYELIKHGRITT